MKDETILAIIEKFAEGKIAGLEIMDGAFQLSLSRDIAAGSKTHDDRASHERIAHDNPSGRVITHDDAKPAADKHASGADTSCETITSPIVGTFYAAPAPDAPPFVKAGDRVKMGDALCILEAMKMMNRLEAEFDCEIISVMPKSGELVEFGQALFEVRRL